MAFSILQCCATTISTLNHVITLKTSSIHWAVIPSSSFPIYQYFALCLYYLFWIFHVNINRFRQYTIFLWLFKLRIILLKSIHTVACLNAQFSSVTQLHPTLWDPMNHSMPGLPVYHQLLEFTQTHVHRVSDAIQPSHFLSSPNVSIFHSFI